MSLAYTTGPAAAAETWHAPWAAPATGQVVSPGRLAAPHAELEGLRRCTECHELGRAGIAPGRCLACHEPLARRIADGSGFHGRLEERNCAACHVEHLGRDADLVRLDTTSFRHDAATGHELRGAHAALACEACHRPSLIRAADVRSRAGNGEFLGRTYLGLATACVACHGADSPHGARYEARSCDGCHDEDRWEEVCSRMRQDGPFGPGSVQLLVEPEPGDGELPAHVLRLAPLDRRLALGLRDAGFTKVVDLEGHFGEWQKLKLPEE